MIFYKLKIQKKIGHILKETFKRFTGGNVFKLSAALNEYTIFSLPPLLIIVISPGGILFGADTKINAYSCGNKIIPNAYTFQINSLKCVNDVTYYKNGVTF